MELHLGALDDLDGWTSLRRDEMTLVVHGDDEMAGRVAGSLDERRGEDVVDIVLDVLTADGFRATPDFALATPDGRVVVRGAGEVRLGEGVDPVVASARMPWRDEDVPEGTEHVTVTVVGAPDVAEASATETEPESTEPDSTEPEVTESYPSDEVPPAPVAPAAEPPSEAPAPPEAPAAPEAPEPTRSAGWAMPSIFGAGAAASTSSSAAEPPAPPAPAPPAAETPAVPDDQRPNLTVVPPPAPAAEPEQPETPAAPEPPAAEAPPAETSPVGEDLPAAPEAGASPSAPLPDQTETDEELPSFDFLFGNTSHHRSSLIAEAEEQEDGDIDSGPVAAAGGFQAPEDAANATLAPPAEDHELEHHEAPQHEPPAPEQPQQEAPEGPAAEPPAPDLPGFTPPPATPAAAAPPPPPLPQDGLIASVPWGPGGTPDQPAPPPAQPDGGAHDAHPQPEHPQAEQPDAEDQSQPDQHPAHEPAAHDPAAPAGGQAPPPQAPFGVGLPAAMPSFGTPTASGPRPIQPAQEHQPFADESTGPMVLAVRCPEGHASAPHAVGCRVCGTALPSQQPEPTPRPSLGVLRMSTGDVVTLDRGVLIGRAPKSAPELPAAQAPHLVRVPSPDNEISRNHVEVILDGWHVLVRDLGSTNGTTITLPRDHPVRLRPGDQQSIEPGTTITLADQVSAVFEVTG